jgi:hypothetical protein
MHVLSPEYYPKIRKLLEPIPFNYLFAKSVVDRHVAGTIFADDRENPVNSYILHPYGMSLLIGDGANSDFDRWLFSYILNTDNEKKKDEWMQVYPGGWNNKIARQFLCTNDHSESDTGRVPGDYIELNQRVNFRFNDKKYQDFKKTHKLPEVQVSRLDKESAGKVRGTVVPSHFWNNPEDFIKNGAGFSIIKDNEPVSTAFSAFVHGNLLEIGVETMDQHRGCGFAPVTCMYLIDFCLDNGYVPVWSCRFENTNSYNLAMKLGFEPSLKIPYYRLIRQSW